MVRPRCMAVEAAAVGRQARHAAEHAWRTHSSRQLRLVSAKWRSAKTLGEVPERKLWSVSIASTSE